MKDQFVTYEIAAKMKELGYDVPCFSYYDKEQKIGMICTQGLTNTFISCSVEAQRYYEFSAPLWQQAIDWLRDEYGIWFKFEPTTEHIFEAFLYDGCCWKFMGRFDKPNQATEYLVTESLKIIES